MFFKSVRNISTSLFPLLLCLLAFPSWQKPMTMQTPPGSRVSSGARSAPTVAVVSPRWRACRVNRMLYYMGATGGGVWKTENAGTTWDQYFG